MDIETLCIVGGSGFVGRSVAEQACAAGYRVRVVTRSRLRARHLTVLPTLEVMVADVNDEAGLARSLDGMDAVINLVGILAPRGRTTFKSAHVDLPRRIGATGLKRGVQRFLHMSALGASTTGPSEIAWTILRPSVIFGEHDSFLNMFASLARISPFIPLACAQARFQPIWVDDVARCFVDALRDPRTFRQAYDLCGPRVYTLEQLVRFAATTSGHPRRILRLPQAAAQGQAFTFEHLPGKILTRDNLRSMTVDNVCQGPFPAVFGFRPSAMEAVAPEYLASHLRARYDQYRPNASR